MSVCIPIGRYERLTFAMIFIKLTLPTSMRPIERGVIFPRTQLENFSFDDRHCVKVLYSIFIRREEVTSEAEFNGPASARPTEQIPIPRSGYCRPDREEPFDERNRTKTHFVPDSGSGNTRRGFESSRRSNRSGFTSADRPDGRLVCKMSI